MKNILEQIKNVEYKDINIHLILISFIAVKIITKIVDDREHNVGKKSPEGKQPICR